MIRWLLPCATSHVVSANSVKQRWPTPDSPLTWVCVLLPAELFEATGAGADAALLNTVIIGAVNVASTIVAVLVVDRCALSSKACTGLA